MRGPGLLALAGLFLLAACATAPTPRPIPGPITSADARSILSINKC